MPDKQWVEESKNVIHGILKKLNITQTEAAALLGTTQSNFSNKLNRGSFRLPEFFKLLHDLQVTYQYFDNEDRPLLDNPSREFGSPVEFVKALHVLALESPDTLKHIVETTLQRAEQAKRNTNE